MTEQRKPTISDELIRYLDEICPDKAPDIAVDERKLWATVGAVGVVRHLKILHHEQRENMLTGDLKN